ncbi:DUF2513 domain-containing protein [Synechococcus lacustris]|uniref:DUF2513 domain-containing protein n=1 Tax=Synechococcus lacustris TaxID=2116544 RepID=UPI0020CEEA71|nr:DUF2513 domain-containing protein [Synechococcus lacustris]MCP9794757.1 DUF2513 domain-containing protein [Synechococcus lacustris L1F-Slac]
MKRDIDLVRQLLIEIEQDVEWPGGECIATENAPRSYHLHLLIQAGLLEGSEHQVIGGAPPRFLIQGLTWQGHELLAASADPGRWNNFKKSAGTGLASIPFPVIVKLLTDGIENSVRAALQSHGIIS